MNMRDVTSNLPTREELLSILGLETRRSATDSVVSSFGIFGAGVMIGAALALLFAPKSGEEMRQDLSQRMTDVREDLERRAAEVKKGSSTSSAGPQA